MKADPNCQICGGSGFAHCCEVEIGVQYCDHPCKCTKPRPQEDCGEPTGESVAQPIVEEFRRRLAEGMKQVAGEVGDGQG